MINIALLSHDNVPAAARAVLQHGAAAMVGTDGTCVWWQPKTWRSEAHAALPRSKIRNLLIGSPVEAWSVLSQYPAERMQAVPVERPGSGVRPRPLVAATG